jgi:hypothetical protein
MKTLLPLLMVVGSLGAHAADRCGGVKFEAGVV